MAFAARTPDETSGGAIPRDARLERFLDQLRLAGMPIGTRETLSAHRLLDLTRDSGAGHGYRRAMFAALMARSPADQKRVGDIFDRFMGEAIAVPLATPPAAAPIVPVRQRRDWRLWLTRLIRRIDPAPVALLIALFAAIGVFLWLAPPTQVKPVNMAQQQTETKQDSAATSAGPAAPSGGTGWTIDRLYAEIDSKVASGLLSPLPTLRELQRLGWPPPAMTAGVPMSLPELVRRFDMAPDEPILVPDNDFARAASVAFADLGVPPKDTAPDLAALPFRFLERFEKPERPLSTAEETKLSIEMIEGSGARRADRADRLRQALRQMLPNRDLAAPAGVDFVDILDRAYAVIVRGALTAQSEETPPGTALPANAFADASWRTPPAAAARPAPLWVQPAAAALPLLVLALWFLSRNGEHDERRRISEKRIALADNPLDNFLVVGAPADILARRTDRQWMARVARSLNVRQAVTEIPVDPEKSVAGSIARGGIFTPVPGLVTASPAYIAVIEARSPLDQEALRLDMLCRRLADAGVAIVRYFQFGDPTRLHPDFGKQPQPIEQVAAQHGDRRLIWIGEGGAMLQPFSREPQPWTAALSQWSDRALLSPRPVGEWDREWHIERALDLPLGSASIEGLMSVAGLMRLDGRPSPGRKGVFAAAGVGDLPPLPAPLVAEPELYLSETNPDGDAAAAPYWTGLKAALQRYLDPAGWFWLRALAFYPALHYDLTLYLGRNLRFGGREVYAERRLAALTRLPWLREGQMPLWLRKRLVDETDLSEMEKQDVLDLIWEILRKENEAALPPALRNLPRVVPYRGRKPKGDAYFRGMVIEEDGLSRLGLPKRLLAFLRVHWEKALIAILLSVAAWWVAPAPGDGAVPDGAYAPLLVLAVAALLALGIAANWQRFLSLWRRVAATTRAGYGRVIEIIGRRSAPQTGAGESRQDNERDYDEAPPQTRSSPETDKTIPDSAPEPSITVYISHEPDADVSSLERALSARGIDRIGADDFNPLASIRDSFRRADVLVVVVSSEEMSRGVRDEIEIALSAGLPILVGVIGRPAMEPDLVRYPHFQLGDPEQADDEELANMAAAIRAEAEKRRLSAGSEGEQQSDLYK